jgi:CMP-N-acetylneuraminic acid synthetase
MKLDRIVALVPMRHHSQRVPGKNFRPLAGKPLFHHILNTLSNCQEIDEIVVDTDSPVIMKGLEESFPHVTLLERPESLRGDTVSMNEILLYDTSQVSANLYLQTHSTNPLLRIETISKGLNTLISNFPGHDSLFSVTRMQTRFWDQKGKPVNHNPAILLQTQDLPPIYEENSCIYLFTRENLVQRNNRLGERPYMFEIDASEAWDIDEELDFKIVDLLMSSR